MPRHLILGIDPGLSGAIAAYDPATGSLTIHDMPTFKIEKNKSTRRELDLHQLATLFDLLAASVKHAFIELVGAMPHDGSVQAFAFGASSMAPKMALACFDVPFSEVPPGKWKRDMGLTGEKDLSRRTASRLLPQHASMWPLVKHDGRAEAALLALWGSRRC